jgi:hypothetical protein
VQTLDHDIVFLRKTPFSAKKLAKIGKNSEHNIGPQDLEECREDMSEEEYHETREDTKDQLK